MGLTEMNNISMDNITKLYNLTTGDPAEFFINVNHYAYGGWLIFILLWILGFILWRKAQLKEDQPLVNAMTVSAVLTVLSFFARIVYIVKDGVQIGLVTDFQMWIFPLLSVLLAAMVRYMSD